MPFFGRISYKPDVLAVTRLSCRLIEADVLAEAVYKEITGLGARKYGLVTIDPPYGLNLHLKTDAVSL